MAKESNQVSPHRRGTGLRVALGVAVLMLLVGGIGWWVGWPGSRTEVQKDEHELITKIELVTLKKEPYRLELSSESGGKYVIKYEDIYTGKRRQLRTPYIPAGDEQKSVFFQDPPVQGRIRLVRVDQRAAKNERNGITSDQMFATVEVLSGPKKGTRYEIERSNRNFIIGTIKAILVLNAPGEDGSPVYTRFLGTRSRPAWPMLRRYERDFQC